MENNYSNFKYLFRKLFVFLFFLVIMLQAYPCENTEEKNSPKPVPKSVTPSSDTIRVPEHIRQRLDNPTYDTRFNKGSMKPWDDRKSIYIRRTILMSTLA